MTYGNAPLERIDLRSLDLFEACPAARGSGSLFPSNALDRWIVVREATVEWHQAGMPTDVASVEAIEEAFFSGWDSVQRRLLRDHFAAYRRLFPPDVLSVDLDPPFGVAIHEETNRSVNVGVQVDVETADGWQALRLKTGRSGTSPTEAAAFYQPDEERTLVDVRLAADDLVTIPRPEDGGSIIDDLATRWDRAVAAPRTGRVAGLHCYSCPRPARCGQYPVIGEGRVTSRTRTLLVSKTRLAAFARCVRSAAWPSVYGVPRDDGDEGDLDSTGLVVGNQFHRSVAAALLSDDPGAIYETAYATVAPSEVDDLRWLFDQHEAGLVRRRAARRGAPDRISIWRHLRRRRCRPGQAGKRRGRRSGGHFRCCHRRERMGRRSDCRGCRAPDRERFVGLASRGRPVCPVCLAGIGGHQSVRSTRWRCIFIICGQIRPAAIDVCTRRTESKRRSPISGRWRRFWLDSTRAMPSLPVTKSGAGATGVSGSTGAGRSGPELLVPSLGG
jgi:hypothetical protein